MRDYMRWLCLAVVVTGLAFAGTARAEGTDDELHEHGGPPPGQGPMAEHLAPIRVTMSPAMEGVFWHAIALAKRSLVVVFACHILLAVWVFLDIRKRGEGHGIFIALTLLAGFCGAFLYALVRLADIKRM
jgi:hypothetical protein